jgi:mannonate dehydratase
MPPRSFRLAAEVVAGMDDGAKAALSEAVVSGLPGAAERWTLEDVRAAIGIYAPLSADVLRQTHIDFLSEVVPLAERLGLRLCCHPDDPPFSLLGLPRTMSTLEDYEALLGAVDSPAFGALSAPDRLARGRTTTALRWSARWLRGCISSTCAM